MCRELLDWRIYPETGSSFGGQALLLDAFQSSLKQAGNPLFEVDPFDTIKLGLCSVVLEKHAFAGPLCG